MPLVHYRSMDGSVEVKNKGFSTPKNITKPQAWINEIRKVVPQVPDTKGATDWHIGSFEPSDKFILIELFNTVGERARVCVMRTSNESQTHKEKGTKVVNG